MIQGLWTSESAVIWGKINENILNKSWDKANGAKTATEEKERELVRRRKSKGEAWVPKHFVLSDCRESGEWEVKPKNINIPPAPIVVRL